MFITLFAAVSIAWQLQFPVSQRDTIAYVDSIREEAAREQAAERARALQEDQTQERVFEMKFNDVARALADLGETWNRSHKLDASKSEKLRKAWRDLERADGWFNASADK